MGDKTPAFWLHAERFEKATGNLTNPKLNRLTAAGIIQRLPDFTTKTAERPALCFNVCQIWRRLVGAKGHEAGRFSVSQWPQKNRINDAEDGSIHADAQRESSHCDRCETGPLQQAAHSVANVLY